MVAQNVPTDIPMNVDTGGITQSRGSAHVRLCGAWAVLVKLLPFRKYQSSARKKALATSKDVSMHQYSEYQTTGKVNVLLEQGGKVAWFFVSSRAECWRTMRAEGIIFALCAYIKRSLSRHILRYEPLHRYKACGFCKFAACHGDYEILPILCGPDFDAYATRGIRQPSTYCECI